MRRISGLYSRLSPQISLRAAQALLVILLGSGSLFAEWPSFDFGIRAGRPQTSVVGLKTNQYSSLFGTFSAEDTNYAVGPTVSANLTDHLAVQVDALYKPVRFNTTTNFSGISSSSSTRAKWWEFVTAKWRFSQKAVQPFVEGGFSFNRVKGKTDSFAFNSSTNTATSSSTTFRLDYSPFGMVAGGGIEFSEWRFRILPELRYTHWTSSSQTGVHTSPDQFDILVGVTLHLK
jgi:hypothetical protein